MHGIKELVEQHTIDGYNSVFKIKKHHEVLRAVWWLRSAAPTTRADNTGSRAVIFLRELPREWSVNGY